MASTAHKSEEEYKEHFDSPEEFEKKIDTLAKWVLESKHFIAFTGAGISTSCGIPDFRSGLQTVLGTGAGVWTLRAATEKGVEPKPKADLKKVDSVKAIPGATHMAFVELLKQGRLKFVISQNTDGLHRRSGVPVDKLAELHGNTNLERCTKCKKEYLRDFRCRKAKKAKNHLTGRLCTVKGCDGKLKDSIINFGESLPSNHLQAGADNSEKADLCIAMGSSLRVFPAADLPKRVAELGKRLVIVNLQGTPLDDLAALRINGMCDDVMRALMKKLKLNLPEFVLRRYVHLQYAPVKGKSGKRRAVTISGVDSDGTPTTLFDSVTYEPSSSSSEDKNWEIKKDPFTFNVSCEEKNSWALKFFGHYHEPDLSFTAAPSLNPDRIVHQVLELRYTPSNGKWAEPIPLESSHELMKILEKSTAVEGLSDKLSESSLD